MAAGSASEETIFDDYSPPSEEKQEQKLPDKPKTHDAGNKGSGSAVCESWSNAQVQQWLCDSGLSHVQSAMEGYDGPCVAQMHRLSQRCPEYFHQALKTELNLDLLSVIKLTIAMDKLFK